MIYCKDSTTLNLTGINLMMNSTTGNGNVKGIRCEAKLTITGSGYLTMIMTSQYQGAVHGISCSELSIEGGVIEVSAASTVNGYNYSGLYKSNRIGNEKGIVMGFTSGPNKGKFMPNDPCTRAQIVLFLYRYAKKPTVTNTELTFADAAEIRKLAPDYTKAILWAVGKGLTTGYGDGTFRPNQTCTRGECATFIYRMVK